MAKRSEHEKKPIEIINLKIQKSDNQNVESNQPADFETAITATGFGKYNLLILFIIIPAGLSTIFETTTMSYVFPAAECDLKLTLNDKGLLNAITYSGMITTAIIWGYLCDTLGRRRLLMIGFFLDSVFVILSGFAQSFTWLVITKFLGGFIINGPYAALASYISEMHCAKYRARMLMVLGIIYSSGSFLLPLIALGVMPLDLEFTKLEYLKLHSWNFYLFICAIPSVTSFLIFIFMPESPKFLMTMGRNDEALNIFKKIYCLNTGKAPSTYPVTELIDEISKQNENQQITRNRTKIQAIREGFSQISPLFFPPHRFNIILVCSIQMFFMMSLNSLRLWLPQIFQAINDHKANNNGTITSLCKVLEIFQNKNTTLDVNCTVNKQNYPVYINTTLIAAAAVFLYCVAGVLINKLGKKKLINILATSGGIAAMSIYFAKSSFTTVVLSSVFNAAGTVAVNVIISVVVDLFPTTLRAMTVSMTMMTGRAGAMFGNLIFPVLLKTSCAAPFVSVGTAIIACAFLSCLLPNTDLKPLE